MRRLIYKAIFDRIFFPSSLVCIYINIKCLSGNKLLHYTWHGYKSLVQTPEKPARVQWVAGWEPHGAGCGSRAVIPGPGCAALGPAASVNEGFADVPIERLWKRLAAHSWHVFCLRLGPALEIWAGKQCQKGLYPLAGLPRAIRPAESVTLTGRVCLLGRCYPVID